MFTAARLANLFKDLEPTLIAFGRNPKIKTNIPVIEKDGNGYKWKLESEHTWEASTTLTHKQD